MNNAEQRALEIACGKLGWYLIALKVPSTHGCVVQAFGIHDAVHQAILLGVVDFRPGIPVAVTDWLPGTPPRPSTINRRLDQSELLELCHENLA